MVSFQTEPASMDAEIEPTVTNKEVALLDEEAVKK
jgi:hypothetical protein